MLRNIYNNKTETAFHDILDEHKIYPEHTNVFEEFILKLAGVNENIYRSPAIHFKDTYGEFHLPISKSSAASILQLNDDFPSLNITDVTHNNAIPTFRLNAEALRILILPLLAAYLKNNPLEVERYQHFSLDSKETPILFANQMDLDKLDMKDDFFFQLISENTDCASLIADYLKNVFPERGLLSLILTYLNIYNIKSLSKDIKITTEEYNDDIRIYPGSYEDAESIKNFFNGLYPSAATIQPNDDKTYPVKLLVKYGTFLHPGFISDCRDRAVYQTIINATKALKNALSVVTVEDDEYQKFFRAGHNLLHELELNGVNNAPLINILVENLVEYDDDKLTTVCKSLRYIANKECEKSPAPGI